MTLGVYSFCSEKRTFSFDLGKHGRYCPVVISDQKCSDKYSVERKFEPIPSSQKRDFNAEVDVETM